MLRAFATTFLAFLTLEAAAMAATLTKPQHAAASLRNAALARDAAAAPSDCGLLWLEHINIVVGERSLAERFYFEDGLGLATDPAKPRGPGVTGTMWANLGNQQFHLAEEAPDDPPQAVRGAIGLVLPDVAEACGRLERLAEATGRVTVERHAEDRFTAVCPWGNVFHCYGVEDREKPGGPKMVQLHGGDGYDGGTLNVKNGPGIRYVHFLVADAEKAAAEYVGEFGGSAVRAGGTAAVACGLGPVHCIFESAPPDAAADRRQDGVHLCVYVDRFAERYERLSETARVFTNPRFKHLDTCDTLAEAEASRTFRFAFPAVPNLEHETRSLMHVQYMKKVFYDR
mmetsp:Transcript_5034/g.14916  ORF Transcript_5034/g.14916 Transcript_5034/m.14916 type:complete len:342 (+) Transcript_5034:172-1197(+)